MPITNTQSITIDCGGGGTMTVTAHPTATPGLVVHGPSPFGGWRLTHRQSTNALGEFVDYEDAQDAAAALHGAADWAGGPEALQDEQVIWKAFLCRKGGMGEQVQAKRAAYLSAQGGVA